jgi:hypothetical protein
MAQAKTNSVRANSPIQALTLLKALLASSMLIACTAPNPIQQAHAKANALSVIDPSWAICLGERAKDYDKGMGRCESAKARTLARAGK